MSIQLGYIPQSEINIGNLKKNRNVRSWVMPKIH